MARLPTVGGDEGNWGQVLNDFLSQEHNPDGTLKTTGSLAAKEDKANKGQPSGYAGLDSSAKLPTTQLPNSVVNASQLPTGPPDYIIQGSGSNYEAFNTATHTVAYTNTDVTLLTQSVITALGTNGGYFYFAGVGQIIWGISGSSAPPTIPAAIGGFGTTPTGILRIGAAPGIYFQLTTYCQNLFAMPTINAGIYQTFQNIIMEDLIVDAGGFVAQTKKGTYQLLFGTKSTSLGTTITGTSFRNLTFSRCKGFNAPTDPSGYISRFWIDLNLYCQSVTDMVPTTDTGPFAGGPLTAYNVLLEDCEFYGGYGPIIAGAGWQTGSVKGAAGIFPSGYPVGSPQWPGGYNPEWFDQIILRRVRHEMTYNGIPTAQGGQIVQRRIYLSSAINTSATTITSNELALYPTFASDQTLSLTLYTAGTGSGTNLPQTETVTITAHTAGSTNATVTRGGSPLSFNAGDWGWVPAWGSNFQLGSVNQGGYCRMEDCHGVGSGDVTIEQDGWNHFVAINCSFTDGQGSGVYTTNYNTPRWPNEQYSEYRNVCVERLNSNMGYGFAADTNSTAIALGTILYDGCTYYRNPNTGAATPGNQYHTAEFGGWGGNQNVSGGGSRASNSALSGSLVNEGWHYNPSTQSGPLTLRDCSATVEGVTVLQGYNATEFLVNVNGSSTTHLTIKNLNLAYTATVSGSNTASPQLTFLEIAGGFTSSSQLLMHTNIEGVYINNKLTNWPSTNYAIGVHYNQNLSNLQSNIIGTLKDVQAAGTGNSSTGGNLQLVQTENSSCLYTTVCFISADNIGWDTVNGNNCYHSTIYVVSANIVIFLQNVPRQRTVTTSGGMYTSDSVIALNATSGSITFQLSNASAYTGRTLTFYRTDTTVNTATIVPQGSQTFLTPGTGTTTSATITSSLVILSNGSNWVVMP